MLVYQSLSSIDTRLEAHELVRDEEMPQSIKTGLGSRLSNGSNVSQTSISTKLVTARCTRCEVDRTVRTRREKSGRNQVGRIQWLFTGVKLARPGAGLLAAGLMQEAHSMLGRLDLALASRVQ